MAYERAMSRKSWIKQLAILSSLSLVSPIQSLQSFSSVSSLSPNQCKFPTASGPVRSLHGEFSNEIIGFNNRQICSSRQHQSSLLPLWASSDELELELETDDDLDAFMEELADEVEAEKKEEKEKDTSHFIERKTAIGIGGNDGFVYDVNALKRNLVQESVRGCKQELLVLLGDGRQDEATSEKSTDEEKQAVSPRWKKDRDDLIEERLSALVQANPVSTTTDSNLLDGEWSFAFATNSASTILDTSRFLLSKTKRIDRLAGEANGKSDNKENAATVRGGPWRFRAGKTENPFRSSSREIYLENLSGDENAHIIDETRILGGLFQISRRYDVFGLTRTALDLDLTASESRLLGFCVNSNSRDDFEGTKLGNPLEIQVLYLDTDLCICTTGAGMDGPLHVYTKSDLWVADGAKRKLRLIAKTASWISTLQSPLRIRQRLSNVRAKRNDITTIETGPGLKRVNIGEVYINKDGATREDSAWDGPDDPFMHLSPGERMEVLKTMSLQDIYNSAEERKDQNKKQKKKWLGMGNRGKKFKRPDL